MMEETFFTTETMAELCVRQGRVQEAIAIYQRLVSEPIAPGRRARLQQRLQALEQGQEGSARGIVPREPVVVEVPRAPGVALALSEEALTVAWALPEGTSDPSLDLLFVSRTPAGVETIKKLQKLERLVGRMAWSVPHLHAAAVAAGSAREGRFIALARAVRN